MILTWLKNGWLYIFSNRWTIPFQNYVQTLKKIFWCDLFKNRSKTMIFFIAYNQEWINWPVMLNAYCLGQLLLPKSGLWPLFTIHVISYSITSFLAALIRHTHSYCFVLTVYTAGLYLIHGHDNNCKNRRKRY